MKKSVLVVLVLVITVFFTGCGDTSTVSETVQNTGVRLNLEHVGLPENYLSRLPEEQAEMIYEILQIPGIRYEDTVISAMGYGDKISDIPLEMSDDLYLAMTVLTEISHTSQEQSKLKKVHVFITFFWRENRPFVKYEDKIAISYNKNIFGTDFRQFSSTVYISDGSGSMVKVKTADRPGSAWDGGAEFSVKPVYFKHSGNRLVAARNITGTAYFYLMPKDAVTYISDSVSDANRTMVAAEYIHDNNLIAHGINLLLEENDSRGFDSRATVTCDLAIER